jgi:hypothetical protein
MAPTPVLATAVPVAADPAGEAAGETALDDALVSMAIPVRFLTETPVAPAELAGPVAMASPDAIRVAARVTPTTIAPAPTTVRPR